MSDESQKQVYHMTDNISEVRSTRLSIVATRLSRSLHLASVYIDRRAGYKYATALHNGLNYIRLELILRTTACITQLRKRSYNSARGNAVGAYSKTSCPGYKTVTCDEKIKIRIC
jgi:hypothetical protein